ncbi:MAG: T9SS type A sorting domain-containing protein, partial [Bacteroidetes bacterium]|nr:T9SS type A sorting domain-containing protein [Bacteroidota bacterium]
AIQSDGKILVAGYSYNGTDNDFALVRYNGGSTGISESVNDALFSVEPNPTTGMFTIELATHKNVPYEVTDISGKMLHKGILTEKRTTIDLSKNEAGVYLLKIDGQSIRLVKK